MAQHLIQLCGRLRTSGRIALERPYIGLYAATQGEADMTQAWARLRAAGWQIALPRVLPAAGMEYREVMLRDHLAPGRFGILEPDAGAPLVEPHQFGAIVVPGLGFSMDGHRIGYGGGYYDRFLQHIDQVVVTIGLAFHAQVVQALPVAPHDIRMQYLITEQGVYDCLNKSP